MGPCTSKPAAVGLVADDAGSGAGQSGGGAASASASASNRSNHNPANAAAAASSSSQPDARGGSNKQGGASSSATGSASAAPSRPMGGGSSHGRTAASASASSGRSGGGSTAQQKQSAAPGGGVQPLPPPGGASTTPPRKSRPPRDDGGGSGRRGRGGGGLSGSGNAGASSSDGGGGGGWMQKRLSGTGVSIPRVSSYASVSSATNGSSSRPKGGGGGGSSAGVLSSSQPSPSPALLDPSKWIPEVRWSSLYSTAIDDGTSRNTVIVCDPADVPSVIDERLSGTINQLSPTEITMIQRRVRDVVRNVASPGGGGGGSKHAGQGLGSGGAGSTMSSVMGRLSLGGGGLGSGSHGTDERSRTVYHKENVLDENLVRRIFVGGGRVLQRGYEDGVAHMSHGVYVRRRDASVASAAASSVSTGGGGGGASSSSPGGDQQNQQQGGSTSRPGRRHNGASRHGQRRQQPQQPPTADLIGSAFTILLHMSESWWDYAAVVARLSASRAGLEMDVNKKKDAAAAAAAKDKDGGQHSSAVPPPVPLMSPTEFYRDDIPSPPPLPGGISMTSLCFLIATALRGTREQRVNLLFYLLLPSEELTATLSAHPAGGIPTWLLECGSETVLSYASLSHYYYYGGNLSGEAAAAAPEAHSDGNAQQQGKLVLSAQRAIGAVAVLLMDALGGADKNADGPLDALSSAAAALDGTAGSSDGKNPKSTNGSGKMHALLNRTLRESREGIPRAWRRGMSLGAKEKLMDTLWGASYADFDSTDEFATSDTVWTQEEFVSWAGRALSDDSVLDMVMHRLFGTGLFPTPSMERDLIGLAWVEWQVRDGRLANKTNGSLSDGIGYLCSLTETVQTTLGAAAVGDGGAGTGDEIGPLPPSSLPWGGIGGIDGRGGLGRGIMYCIEKRWWDEWMAYSGWTWADDGDGGEPQPPQRIKTKRPHELSTDGLLIGTSESIPAGTLGSYEPMAPNVSKGADYVLIPPATWDILYELYGGGPPLPRMVLPLPTENGIGNKANNSLIGAIVDDMSSNVEVVAAPRDSRPLKIPLHIEVATHPWVLHCHICDPHQPYRRGDAGPLSIRVMATPEQPLWRLLGEIVVRLPVHHPRARDSAGLGRARLWKRTDPPNVKDASAGIPRYGPWGLLCKSRCASFPVGDLAQVESYDNIKEDWLTYTDNGSVESAGLSDGMKIMFEYGLVGKDGKFTWPREAAAKAGHVRRIADEDADFKLKLRGLDSNRKLIQGDSPLLGKTVDAMDASGRWYQAEVVEMDNKDHVDEDDDAKDEDGTSFAQGNISASGKPVPGEIKAVRVDFSQTGGHDEWIDVKSDRLAVVGRFTLDSLKNLDSNLENGQSSAQSGEVKGKSPAAAKKHPGSNEPASDPVINGKVCPFPGYGACGLTNLGNTCYANSALQCISYMPMLRSYLISGQYKVNGDLNKDNPLGTGGKVLEEFVELLRVMYSGKHGVRAPSRLRGQLGKAKSQYSGGDQQDAQELLNDMFDSLHEDSNKVMKKPYVEALEDDWVKHTGLPRVGLEAWRRFLRRNRSVIADVAMGQVLNRVTCPVCNHESRNFDPFNMLSIPFPTVAEVIFRCKVVRRGTVLNCPGTLGRTKRSAEDDNAPNEKSAESPAPPSGKLIIEEYIVPMSRLADVGDLKLRLQNSSGISANRFRLCKAEEIVVNASTESGDPARTYFKVTALPEKEGPCIQLARQLSANNKQASAADNVSTPSVTQIIAFESTLSNRPPLGEGKRSDSAASSDATDEESTADEDDEEARGRSNSTTQHQRILQKQLEVYGDRDECRLLDTNPTPLSKAMSRSLWPKVPADFKLGLRVDAIDHRNHWFPGSVVEIIEGSDESGDEEEGEGKGEDVASVGTKVRIHFDNFSSKWDETYTIDHFKRGQVRPLYSHANPRPKPTEFLVHHRHKYNKGNALFGQPFYLQCHNEWSTARAGAQILAQASRFLQSPESRRRDQSDKFYQSSEKARVIISQIIDMLIESDRKYVDAALRPALAKDSEGRDRLFNASVMSAKLSKKLSTLLPMLPFDVRVCTADSPLGGHQGTSSDEVAFPFSLVRTIGNYMNARHAVVLHWREKSASKHRAPEPPRRALLYAAPMVGVHKRSRELLKPEQGGKASDSSQGGNTGAHGGLQLGVCLDEFCKEQHLPETDNWRCPKCKEVREGKQHMILWRLPDILTFHLKRFNCSARWREKITTKVNFPLTGLNMSEWCDEESPALDGSAESCVYDLIGVMNHYGGMTGGHYVATCKATACGAYGSEEVAYSFNGAGINEIGTEEETVQSGWKLGRSKEKDAANASSKAATAAARFVAESSEPLWLQFDDDLVEPIPPKHVVSEMAYVLFYRRRRISPSNIAKYSTLD